MCLKVNTTPIRHSGLARHAPHGGRPEAILSVDGVP